MMSVAYEPRAFIHEGGYPPMDDGHDRPSEPQRFTDNDVAEQLSHYTAEASILPGDRNILNDDRSILNDDRNILNDDRNILNDDRNILNDDRGLMSEDAATAQEVARLELSHPSFPSPMQATVQISAMPDGIMEDKDLSPAAGPSTPSRVKPIPKPDREVEKQADGKFHCPLDDCKEDIRIFSRKCEWNKHMDKHERPYRCPADGCENLPGFTYSGGLLRHEREVHGKHGGPKNTVNCPHPNCKRHTGKGFSRQENLNEHLRRVHTILEGGGNGSSGGGQSPGEAPPSPDDNESEKAGMKRKRRSSGQGSDEMSELREEIKRVREENEKLKADMDQQSQHSLAMMAQIAELQDALRHGLSSHNLNAPTAQMI